MKAIARPFLSKLPAPQLYQVYFVEYVSGDVSNLLLTCYCTAALLAHCSHTLNAVVLCIQAKSQAEGLIFVAPYDDPYTIAGQGTIGTELLRQLSSTDLDSLHAIFVAIGGGGLIAGIAAYVKALRPEVKIIGVEPTGIIRHPQNPFLQLLVAVSWALFPLTSQLASIFTLFDIYLTHASFLVVMKLLGLVILAR